MPSNVLQNDEEFAKYFPSMAKAVEIADSPGSTGLQEWVAGLAPQQRDYLRRQMAWEKPRLTMLARDVYEKEPASCAKINPFVEGIKAAAEGRLNQLKKEGKASEAQPKYLEKISLLRSLLDEEDEIATALLAAEEDEEARRADVYKMIQENKGRLTIYEADHARAKVALERAAEAIKELSDRKQEIKARMQALPGEVMPGF